MTEDYLRKLKAIADIYQVNLMTVQMLAREKKGEIKAYYPERNQHVRPRGKKSMKSVRSIEPVEKWNGNRLDLALLDIEFSLI